MSEKKLEKDQFNQKDKTGIDEYFTPRYGKPMAFGYTADIYRSGDRVLKVFSPEFSKAMVYREACVMACIEDCGIRIPSITAVREEGGFWLTESEFVEGRDMLTIIFGFLASGDAESAHGVIRRMAAIQAKINRTSANGLQDYKAYAASVIRENTHLTETTRTRTLELLKSLPDGNGICHGDFHPQNVIVNSADEVCVLDWVEAGGSHPACDPARTYMNLCYLPPVPLFQNPDLRLAQVYMDAYTEQSGLTREEILAWLPVHAAISYGEKAEWYSAQIRKHLL